MNFNSLRYLVFLPVVCLVHWILPERRRWLWLLGMSWLFYFLWDPRAGLLLVGTTAVTWLCGWNLGRNKGPRRLWMALALIATLGVLGVFKYAGFFASLAGMDISLRILLPVGISFYTFQTLSYVLDVYRGDAEAEPHFGYYALFVTFFPQLVAGPIERTGHLLPQLKGARVWKKEYLREGFWLLLAGFFKKIVVADSLAPLVDRVYGAPGESAGAAVILATVLFGFQILCDFSGYTDIARGSAKFLGVELMENFRRPYFAASVREFWRRWHISLTAWLTDYVYIPLGGSRKGLARQLAATLIVFLLSGLWHGAGWTFLCWGAIHGFYMVLGTLWVRLFGEKSRLPRGLRQVRTFCLVTFAWLLFRAETLGDAAALLSRLPALWTGLHPDPRELLRVGLLLLLLPLVELLPEKHRKLGETGAALAAFFLILSIGLAWLAHLSAGGENAFIYFRF